MIITKINRAQTINKVKKAIHDTEFSYGHVYYSKGIKKWNQLTIAASAKAVDPSYMLALATSISVRREIID